MPGWSQPLRGVDRSCTCGKGSKEGVPAASSCCGRTNRGRCITGFGGLMAGETTQKTWKSTTPTATDNDTANRRKWSAAASRKRRLKGLSRMRCKAHVRFLGEGALVTAPPYPTEVKPRNTRNTRKEEKDR